MTSPSPTARMAPDRPALATTKRKFYKLLDNLAAGRSTSSLASTLNAPNASTASLNDPMAPEPPSKRSRVSEAGLDKDRAVSGSERIRYLQEKLFAPLTPRKPIDRTVGAGMRAVNSSTTPKLSTPRKDLNYLPYSQEQFLGRLKTFADVKKWPHKPEAISEMQWAKQGWVCVAWNTVACKGGCEQRVVVQLYPLRKDDDGKEIPMSEDVPDEVDEGLVEKYRELIVDGHYEDCLWRKHGCSDDIYHLSIPNRAKSTAELLERYHSFKAIADELPLFENIIYPEPSMAEVLKRTPPAVFTPPGATDPEPPTSPAEITAFAFALFGWTGVLESKIALATCGHCFQRIGLWLYKTDHLKEMSDKLDLPIESLGVNLVDNHRDHCPWKNPDTQRNPEDSPISNMAAWQTLEFLLMGTKRRVQNQSVGSIDLESYRDSVDSDRGTVDTRSSKDVDSLYEKWRKLKTRLRRTTSRKSVKSVKSVKSTMGKAKENEKSAAA